MRVFVAISYVYKWCLVRGKLCFKKLDRHQGSITAVATLILCGLTWRYVVNSNQQLEAFQSDARARVTLSAAAVYPFYSLPNISTSKARGWLVIKNVGKTPAFDVKMSMDEAIVRKGQPFSKDDVVFRMTEVKAVPPTLYPDGIATIASDVGDQLSFIYGPFQDAALSPVQSPIFLDDSHTLYWFERITYTDVFGKTHQSHFCGEQTGTQQFAPSQFYNDTDDYQGKK
jgi:hypothetical protein